MNLPDTEPQIDFAHLSFPSDAITIGYLRQRFPPYFKSLDPDCFRVGQDDMAALILAERTLAKWAFDKALERPTVSDEKWHEKEEGLETTYPEVGLATGSQHAQQMIRDLKEAAAAQAHAYLGKGR